MKSAVYVPLENEVLTEERINLEPKIPPKSTTFKYEESSKSLAKVSLIADPYESRCVYVQKSDIAGEVREAMMDKRNAMLTPQVESLKGVVRSSRSASGHGDFVLSWSSHHAQAVRSSEMERKLQHDRVER